MKLGELQKVIEKLKKYELPEKIDDISSWLESLNSTQIDNFLKLDTELSDIFKDKKSPLVNLQLLNTKHYLKDIELLNNADSIEVLESLHGVNIICPFISSSRMPW